MPDERAQIARSLNYRSCLVARTLEGVWEDKLRAVETVEHEYQAWLQQDRLDLTAEYAYIQQLQARITALSAAEKTDHEIAAILNQEGLRSARGASFNNKTIWLLRHEWSLPPAQPCSPEPMRWEDATYTIIGAAAAIGVFPGAIPKWLRTGHIQGHQRTEGAPWEIPLGDEQITALRNYTARVRPSKKEAS